jgi:hypothetical protein
MVSIHKHNASVAVWFLGMVCKFGFVAFPKGILSGGGIEQFVNANGFERGEVFFL